MLSLRKLAYAHILAEDTMGRVNFKLPTLTRGEWTYARVAPQGSPNLRPPSYTGSPSNERGGSYLFVFPFDIYLDDESTDVQTSFVDSTEVRIYPPFLNDTDDQIAIAQAQLEAVPSKPDTTPPAFDKVRLKTLYYSMYSWRRTNALRVDLSPDREAEFATAVVQRWLGLVRWWTRQWWIGRDRRPHENYPRNWFSINELGERLSGVHAFFSAYGGFGIEQPFTLQMFQNVRGNLTNGRRIPISWDTFLDAIYFHGSYRLDRAVLEAAIACEANISEAMERVASRDGISAAKLTSALASNDFTVQLDRGVTELTGASFPSHDPVAFKALKLLRTARGNVAHGQQPLIPDSGGSRLVAKEDVFDMLDATLSLFNWLAKL